MFLRGQRKWKLENVFKISREYNLKVGSSGRVCRLAFGDSWDIHQSLYSETLAAKTLYRLVAVHLDLKTDNKLNALDDVKGAVLNTLFCCTAKFSSLQQLPSVQCNVQLCFIIALKVHTTTQGSVPPFKPFPREANSVVLMNGSTLRLL
jgi:hypothetical protein